MDKLQEGAAGADGSMAGAAASAPGAGRGPAVVARDASYARRGYRSFEYASFAADPGRVTLLVSATTEPVRDLLLAIAGAVAPTAGSLTVDGVERCRAAGRTRARRAARVGVGVVSGFIDQEPAATVGEALACELALRGAGSDTGAVLDQLARFGLATHVDQQVERLEPSARFRLSAAIALAWEPQVAVVDGSDAFCQGLSAAAAAAIVRDLARIARAADAAVLVGSCDPALAAAADAAYPLDMESAEALARLGIACAGSVSGAQGE